MISPIAFFETDIYTLEDNPARYAFQQFVTSELKLALHETLDALLMQVPRVLFVHSRDRGKLLTATGLNGSFKKTLLVRFGGNSSSQKTNPSLNDVGYINFRELRDSLGCGLLTKINMALPDLTLDALHHIIFRPEAEFDRWIKQFPIDPNQDWSDEKQEAHKNGWKKTQNE